MSFVAGGRACCGGGGCEVAGCSSRNSARRSRRNLASVSALAARSLAAASCWPASWRLPSCMSILSHASIGTIIVPAGDSSALVPWRAADTCGGESVRAASAGRSPVRAGGFRRGRRSTVSRSVGQCAALGSSPLDDAFQPHEPGAIRRRHRPPCSARRRACPTSAESRSAHRSSGVPVAVSPSLD